MTKDKDELKQTEKSEKIRFHLLDVIRGITIINMIIYHGLFDVVTICGIHISFYSSIWGHIYQQMICWTFIFLSGMCRALGSRNPKRGIIVSLCGILITLVTMIFLPEEKIIFGVLTMLGAAMLITLALDKVLRQIPNSVGLGLSLLFFFVTRNVYSHSLGFEGLVICKLPDFLYKDYFTAFLGFPFKGFFSGDYFPIIPWIFLFLAGFYFCLIIKDKEKIQKILSKNVPVLSFLGRHSLFIYMLHQVVLYIAVLGIYYCLSAI